jgi:hypothetical protein
VREGKRTKERERVVGKAAGDECVFILEGAKLADEVGVRRHTGRGGR